MKREPLAIFEMSLLANAGVAVRDAYEAILTQYQSDTEVCELFNDLIADWDGEASPKMISPFIRRASTDTEFELAVEFVTRGALTADVSGEWSLLAYALLLKRKIAKLGVVPEDVLLARYILGYCPSGGATESLMRTWSESPLWQDIVSRGVETFPDVWWSTIDSSPTPQELPTRLVLEETLSLAGVPELMQETQHTWNRYVSTFTAVS
jgi:hypothetical protein